jgi:hypothetical protein
LAFTKEVTMFRDISRPFVLPLVMGAAALGYALPVLGDDDDNNRRLSAVPFAFVGTAEDCNPFPAGSNIVTAAWLGGMGLPDNGGPNTTAADLATNPDKRNPHRGLLLSKNGPTPDCSAAGAEIRGVRGMMVTPTFELGYDYRNGGHCGAGAPRFNVSYTLPNGTDGFSFVGGCSNDSTPTAAPQDPLQWSRVRFQTSDPAESFPVIPPGSRIQSINLIFDEGTDIPTLPRPSGDLGNPAGIGLTVVDNIFINGRVISSGSGIEPKPGERDRHDD